MAIAITLQEYLRGAGIDYDLVPHPETKTSMETAAAAHVPGNQLAKSVVLEDDKGYMLAVVPSSHRVQLGRLHKQLNRSLGLATEPELEELFPDCEVGAVPVLGAAYGIETVVDDSLEGCSDIYFEAGDHARLVHISGDDFRRLTQDIPHGRFSRRI
jgi:Ala-tRNA(Pro) deacylase